MLSRPQPPSLYFGTGIVGCQHLPTLTDKDYVSKFLDDIRAIGISKLDTAAHYPHDNIGGSERLLGQVDAVKKGYTINTKVAFASSVPGSLSSERVRESVALSLKQLKVPSVDILYAHLPDPSTPLEEQADALNEQYQKGLCKRIGVCNFAAPLLEAFLAVFEAKGYVKPSVYQGQYNVICRAPEDELIPLLRRHNMSFVAYSPLGGGFLTGKLTAGSSEGTRLEQPFATHFRNWYDRAEFHDAIRAVEAVIKPLNITMPQVAMRWLAYHSLLGENDGIILGATRAEQVRQNVDAIGQGPLPQEVVDKIAAVREVIGESALDFVLDPSKLPKNN